jgi:hypothetical protein
MNNDPRDGSWKQSTEGRATAQCLARLRTDDSSFKVAGLKEQQQRSAPAVCRGVVALEIEADGACNARSATLAAEHIDEMQPSASRLAVSRGETPTAFRAACIRAG